MPAACRGGDGARELLERVLQGFETIGRRDHATGRHHLDLVGAATQFFACRPADLVRPVGDGVDEADVLARVGVAVVIGGAALVAVPTGLAERSSGNQ